MTYVSKSPAQLAMDLIPSGVGSFTDPTNAWKLLVGRMIDQPDTQIGFFDAPGQAPDPKWLLDYPAVQVIVRGAPQGYEVAAQKMRDVYDVLLGADPRQNANGDWVDAITVLSTPVGMGYDKQDRPEVSGNFRMIIRPVASQYTNREPL